MSSDLPKVVPEATDSKPKEGEQDPQLQEVARILSTRVCGDPAIDGWVHEANTHASMPHGACLHARHMMRQSVPCSSIVQLNVMHAIALTISGCIRKYLFACIMWWQVCTRGTKMPGGLANCEVVEGVLQSR